LTWPSDGEMFAWGACSSVSFADQLYETAVRLAQYAQSNATALQQELVLIETRKRELEEQLETVSRVHERLLRFVAIRGTDFQCPRCWIDHETRSNLQPTGKGTSNTDYFRCGTCGYEFPLRF
jgi:DNA-directed RNA polymerase subunit M/transcription elongation factor TFIIS